MAKREQNKSQSRLLAKYHKEVVPAMREKFGYKSIMAVPRIEKVVINVGFGRRAVVKETAAIEKIEKDLAKLTGQKPAVRKAKKSISGFKVRQGMETWAMAPRNGLRKNSSHWGIRI